MSDPRIPDASTPFGEKFHRRMSEEAVIWLTTLSSNGTPQPNPLWFVWEGDSVLLFTRPDAHRLDNIRRDPRVSLNLNSTPTGGDVVVLTGLAEIGDGDPTTSASYEAKYHEGITRISGSIEEFAKSYSIPIRVRINHVRGF